MNEISKVIWKLNSDTDLNLAEKQQYDIMFVLTPGSTNDYEITNQFIQTMNQVVAEKIKLVICLDSLSHAGNLTIHVGSVKSDQEEYAKGILKTLKHSAALNNKALNF